uniref:Protein OBERON 3 n=1 Tax=Chenopodium quinoa TaxID=63459 RepID=A0A803M7M6_CHEQI
EEKWVERDFLQLSNSDGGTSKREAQEDGRRKGDGWKKPKLETQTLDLSLALPNVSLSLSASNAAPPNCDAVVRPMPCRSVHCSLTHNSTDYYENSVGSRRRETDQIWNCGEGTNGSVHSRFKPIGDGVSLSNHGGGGVAYTLLNRSHTFNRDPGNSLYRAAASDTSSFFPSELPAKPRTDLCFVDSMSKSLDQGLNNLEDMKGHKLSRGERIVRDVITEHATVMSQLSRELPAEAIESAKEYLNCLMASPEKKDELVCLQNLLEKRSELTTETLSKSDRLQLEILVAVKFGLNDFVSGKARLPTSELAEIFFFQRCRNINCKSLLPVDDCDCKICSTKKGFCSQCMCSVCYNYDCANNTCSWVGCDACSHWCHAACGAENNLIRPGPSLKGSSGKTEMQFYCVGCGHASEMFGFVKDVFIFCAKEWGIQTLIKELDCVRRIFKGSEDLKGKELYLKAAELLTRLERRAISPSDACHVIIHFFTSKSDKEDTADFAPTGVGANELTASQGRRRDNVFPSLSSNLAQKSSFINSATMLQGLRSYDFHQSSSKPNLSSERQLANEWSGNLSNKDGFDSMESIIRLKETEARMFQNRADEARKEVDTYRQMVETKTVKLDEEYSEKLAKLCLQEAEERRRKKLEELRILENTHSDYYKMKIRMQSEISSLVERMEATKQLWV